LAASTLIRRAVPEDLDTLTEVLCRAFDTDPVMNWFVRPDSGREAAFRRFFELALRRLTMPHGEVYTTSGRDATACWTPPGRGAGSLLDQVLMLAEYVRICGPRRFPGVMRALAPIEARHPRHPHFYLFLLGVLPGSQGRGLGSALLQKVLERCDREAIPAYLENSNPRNLPLYQRHGFRVTAECPLGGAGGPSLWLMWRDPEALG
jgi:ribosomal protein S18 acetylase RimI-like enzyme